MRPWSVLRPLPSVRAVQIAVFAAAFDGLLVGPMLVDMAEGFRRPLAETVVAATLYFLSYGLMQPVWGAASDRLGRSTVLRLGMGLGLTAAVVAAAAPTLEVLVAARTVGGGTMAALMPTAMTWVGDRYPRGEQHGRLASLVGAWAAGTAGGTLGGGLAVGVVGWRAGFAASALLAVVGLLVLRRVPDAREPVGRSPVLAQVGAVLRDPTLLALFGLVGVEGAILLAGLTYMAPALEHEGVAPSLAGTAVALYGVAGVGWAMLAQRLRWRIGLLGLIVTGGTLLTVGYATAALSRVPVGIAAAAALIAGTFGLMHSALQVWATETDPDRRATVVALFAACFFAGNAISTQLFAGLADRGAFSTLFAVFAGSAAVLTAVTVLARIWAARRRTGLA